MKNGGSMNNMEIGNRIKSLRKKLGITQMDIMKQTGISSGNLSSIENGNVLPSATALVALSEILGCSVDYILKGNSSNIENSIFSNNKETLLLNEFRKLTEKDQDEILGLISLKINLNKVGDENSEKLSPSATAVSDTKFA